MKKILVMAVLLCSFVIIDFAGAEEENNPDQVVAETHDFALERYKNIFELHHPEKVEPIPNWHKHLPREAEDSRCSKLIIDPVDNSTKCQIELWDW